ncbi:hypothetical protein OSTOST_23037, partial [Ostertagia ostertagi]
STDAEEDLSRFRGDTGERINETESWNTHERRRRPTSTETNLITNPFQLYIGIMTAAEAEKLVPEPTTFHLYHQIATTLEEMRSDSLHAEFAEACNLQSIVHYHRTSGD